MAEEIDENGVYREDFSTESDWEVFIAQLGEICQKWEIGSTSWGREFMKDELYNCQWEERTETLELLRKHVDISYHVAVLETSETSSQQKNIGEEYRKDLMSTLNSFAPLPFSPKLSEIHTLARLYGLRRFILIRPRKKNRHFLSNMSEFSFFLSAATVVSAEVSSSVPIFVQIYDPKWNFFIGVGHGCSTRTVFDLVALDQTPAHCRYLYGLLPMFKEKIKQSNMQPSKISVQNTYALDKVRLRIPMYVPFSNAYGHEDDFEDKSKINLTTTEFITLPHGYFRDSYIETFAVYTWPALPENIVVDSALTSVFVPSKAPKGNIYHVAYANSYLSSCLTDFQELLKENKHLEDYVGKNFSGNATNDKAGNPLYQLTKTRPVKRRNIQIQQSRESIKKLPGPMNETELMQMINYLFPNLNTDDFVFTYSKTKDLKKDPMKIKSAYPDSLVCRLSSLLATVNSHFGGKSGLAQLWAAFTRQLWFCWDNYLTIPGVEPGFPDTRTCLLHQKLQMLNIAIERSARRQNMDSRKGLEGMQLAQFVEPEKGTLGGGAGDNDNNDDDDEEDEFYECPDFEEAGNPLQTNSTKDEEEEKKNKINLNTNDESTRIVPEGRLKRLGNLNLLNSDEPLYIPITQEPVPKTEDQLKDDAEVMLKLGPGSGLTTQMMCSSLRSDMEAFKAANPSAVIEDFIRWYSPKDWTESIDETGAVIGSLTPRMKNPNNTWHTVWNEAKPVPVSRQKRLFDDTNEALKVLYYLENRTICEIYELVVVPLIDSAILKLQDILTNANVFDIFEQQIEDLKNSLCYLSRSYITSDDESSLFGMMMPNFEQVLAKIKNLEEDFYQYKGFERICEYPQRINLKDLQQQFKEFLKNGGSYSVSNKKNFQDNAQQNISFSNELRESLISKDYIIRLEEDKLSGSTSTNTPQFLRAIITGDKLRICSAFTENTTFV